MRKNDSIKPMAVYMYIYKYQQHTRSQHQVQSSSASTGKRSISSPGKVQASHYSSTTGGGWLDQGGRGSENGNVVAAVGRGR